MESARSLKTNTYHYRDGFYIEVVYDMFTKVYDAWLYNSADGHRMFIRSIPEPGSSREVMPMVTRGMDQYILKYEEIFQTAV